MRKNLLFLLLLENREHSENGFVLKKSKDSMYFVIHKQINEGIIGKGTELEIMKFFYAVKYLINVEHNSLFFKKKNKKIAFTIFLLLFLRIF